MAAMAMRDWNSADVERASLLGAMLACGLLALTCVWLAVKLLWLLVPTGGEVDTAQPIVAVPAPNQRTAVSISKWHLFGNAGLTTAQLARNAPATQLQLQLHGTLAEADPRSGMAVIADPVSGERAYRVGDGLPGGATLDGVYPDRVILLHEGVQETLGLPYDQPGAAMTPAATAAAPNTGGRNTAPVSASAPTPAQMPAATPVFVAPQMAQGAVDFSRLQQQLGVADQNELMRQISAQPVMENGRMAGVRLSGGPNAALIAQLGLQPTDIVTSINNVPLDSMGRATQVVDSLKNASRVTVTVNRDGKPVTLSVNIK
ncbi:MAG: type II secretion system protein GspC [Lysobacteraceae bacterium SCN 69-320]|nr:MAG: type II secretion system protein GspC [Xanthomonadaceae bacterium SCN 69-320]